MAQRVYFRSSQSAVLDNIFDFAAVFCFGVFIMIHPEFFQSKAFITLSVCMMFILLFLFKLHCNTIEVTGEEIVIIKKTFVCGPAMKTTIPLEDIKHISIAQNGFTDHFSWQNVWIETFSDPEKPIEVKGLKNCKNLLPMIRIQKQKKEEHPHTIIHL